MKRYETEEIVGGKGDVFREDGGARVGCARYRITIQHGVLDASMTGTAGLLRGVRRISGEVHFNNAGPFGRTDLLHERLILHLEDGQRLHFTLSSATGRFDGGRFSYGIQVFGERV